MDNKTAQQANGLASFVWQIAETLRGDFKQSEYGKVILPFVVLRRLDCILEPSKEAVLKAHSALPPGIDEQTRDMMLFGAIGGGIRVYNTSKLSFATIKAQNPAQLHDNLVAYITSFSTSVKDVFLDKFLFIDQLKRLNEAAILWKVFEQFAALDLRPQSVSTLAMGYLFEDLIRRFSEISNETAGEHFTPREVIRLIVDLLLVNDALALTGKGIIRQVYDPACGTGGMLALTEEGMKDLNPDIRVELFGQELNGESFGICKSDMLVTGHDPEQIAFGNTLTHDAHKGKHFHYMLSNPPYGVDWKKYADPIRDEHERLGKDGRFGAGLPRISDGQLLFLQHMIAKMRDDEAGSRIGIVMNGSPLFTGGAASGESEIRRWMLENDWVEAIVALPTDLFYNTGIQTYVWLLTNRKETKRRGKVQLIDASGERFWKPMRKNLGSKRREIRDEARETISHIFHEMANGGGGVGRRVEGLRRDRLRVPRNQGGTTFTAELSGKCRAHRIVETRQTFPQTGPVRSGRGVERHQRASRCIFQGPFDVRCCVGQGPKEHGREAQRAGQEGYPVGSVTAG
jgi:type I restriction enzyme M protein